LASNSSQRPDCCDLTPILTCTLDATILPGSVFQAIERMPLARRFSMIAIVILAGLLIGLIVLDLAALRWGVDSRINGARPYTEWRRRRRGAHGT
jgi:hypothetical protein